MNEIIKTDDGKGFTDEEIQLFDKKYLEAMKNIAKLEHMKKSCEDEEKKIKEQFKDVFEQYGIKSIDNEYLKASYVAAGRDSVTIDLKEFQDKEPETYADILKDYPKETKGKSAYVRFTVKDKK